MNTARLWWLLTEIAASGLASPERDAVLGDLAEGAPASAATLGDVLGLIARRHVTHWRAWQPWIAGFGVAMPTALVTMGASLALSRSVSEAAALQGLPAALAAVAFRATTLALWAWTCGLTLGALSPRTLWASTTLALLPCLFCLSRYHDAALPFTSLLLFLPALLGGALRSRRRPAGPTSTVAVLACAVSISVAVTGAIGTWWTWPAWLLVLLARQQHRETLA